MVQCRLSRWVRVSLTLTLILAPSGWSQERTSKTTTSASREANPTARDECTCVVYALKDLGDDPNLGKWIAETIPQVIKPGSWHQENSTDHRISYYAQGKILVVYHNAAVH